ICQARQGVENSLPRTGQKGGEAGEAVHEKRDGVAPHPRLLGRSWSRDLFPRPRHRHAAGLWHLAARQVPDDAGIPCCLWLGRRHGQDVRRRPLPDLFFPHPQHVAVLFHLHAQVLLCLTLLQLGSFARVPHPHLLRRHPPRDTARPGPPDGLLRQWQRPQQRD
ncbi:hypothetical protein BN1708_019016, partial [Verticillium longisporum]